MKETAEFIRVVDRISQVMVRIPEQVATIAVNFSKDRFRSQNWVDSTTETWPKRKPGWIKDRRTGRAILVDSGRLRRSIRKVSVSESRIVIGTDVPHARAHNDGYRGTVKQNVGPYTRKKMGTVQKGTGVYNIRTRAERTRSTRGQVGTIQVKAHTRTIRQNIPRRRFLGPSAALNRQVERFITAQFMRAIKG